MTTAPELADPRKRRTREALLQAFFGLVLEHRYHEIRIADVLARAGVSRSTFYEHFRSKDALLAASIAAPFTVLVGSLGGQPVSRLQAMLEHFWQNRAMARGIFQGAAYRPVRAVLVAMVEQRLKREHGAHLRLPPRLAANALADAMLSPIVAWLAGEAACPAGELADALQASNGALLAALTTRTRA